MIGPGWMPSRPRPLPRVRRGPWAYTPGYLARRRAPRRRPPGPATTGEPVDLSGFDGGPIDLATATLLPGRSQARVRAISGDLRHWLAQRWGWLRPRTVPMLVALAGMFAVIGAERYLMGLARGERVQTHGCYVENASVHALDSQDPSDACGGAPTRTVWIRTLVEPSAHRAPDIELTFAPAASP